MQAACRLAPHPTSLRAARDFASEVLGEEPSPFMALVGLLVTELVTNAIVHAQTSIVVTVTTHESAVRVAVRDESPARPFLKTAAPTDVTGRGMAIVDGLADAWGVETAPGAGKTVWFEVEQHTATEQ